MPFPRKPPGEKPAVTIKWLRRQLLQAEQTIGQLRNGIEVWQISSRGQAETARQQSETIAGLNLYKSDMEEEVSSLKQKVQELAARNAKRVHRIAYLEGYYRAKQEALCPASASIASHQSDPIASGRARDTGDVQNGEQVRNGPETRNAPASRDEVRRERESYRQDQKRYTLEDFEVGVPRDAEPRRYRDPDGSTTITFP